MYSKLRIDACGKFALDSEDSILHFIHYSFFHCCRKSDRNGSSRLLCVRLCFTLSITSFRRSTSLQWMIRENSPPASLHQCYCRRHHFMLIPLRCCDQHSWSDGAALFCLEFPCTEDSSQLILQPSVRGTACHAGPFGNQKWVSGGAGSRM